MALSTAARLSGKLWGNNAFRGWNAGMKAQRGIGGINPANRPMIHKALVSVDFEMFLDRPHVKRKLNAAVEWVFAKTGGYVMMRMRRSIRKPLKYTRDRRVEVLGREYYIDKRTAGYEPRYTDGDGWVFDWKIYKKEGRILYAKRQHAMQAMKIFFYKKKADGWGRPPRQGPTNLLRRFILFGYTTDTLLIGPHIFSEHGNIKAGNKGNTVPDLLEAGGTKTIQAFGTTYHAEYLPHPYVIRQSVVARKKFAENIEKMEKRLYG